MGKRIVQVFNRYLAPGGEEASVERIYQSIRDRHEVERLLFASSEWAGAGAPPKWRQALLSWRNPESIRRLREVVAGHRPDLLLFHNVFPVGSASLYGEAHALGVPIVQYVHNFRPYSVGGYLWAGEAVAAGGLQRNYWAEIKGRAWQDSMPKTAYYAGILQLMHRRGDFARVAHWIAISEFMREAFIDAGVPAGRITALRHSWDSAEDGAAAGEDGGYYLFLGRLIPAKGIRVLLDAWAILASRFSPCPRLVIAGDGPMEGEIRAARDRGLPIEFRGRVGGDEKSALLRGCRAMVAPSLWWEPLGIVTYEAYDHAKPMLAARSGGLAETVQSGETGLLHEPGDVLGLADDVQMLEGSAEVRARLGSAGRRWLLAHTSRQDWQARFDAIVDPFGAG